ncbi:MAG: hypothetical protein VB122_09045 [Erysipelotrichales bacterium]|nr:hypothetical protein [Erysipelotrichales bacterium]HCJ56283.1 hypothetical protein [Clostridiaceae bacterium]
MVKRALKSAIGVSIGTTIGGVVLPRILFFELYNNTYPPILEQTLLYFIISYVVCFFVALLIEWIKNKMRIGR